MNEVTAGWATGITFSNDDKLIAVSIFNMKYFLYDLAEKKRIQTAETKVEEGVPGPNAKRINIAFSPDNQFFAAGESNKKVTVWEIRSGNVVAVQNGNYTDAQYIPERFSDGKYQIRKYQDGFCFNEQGLTK